MNDSQMLCAMGRISFGSDAGTPCTQGISSESVIAVARSRPIPRSLGARAASESLVPWQSGQTPSLRYFSSLFIPFSSLTLAREFLTELTAL